MSLALVSPAFSQDGPHDAAAAQNAAQAFGIYLDGVLKSGGEPDFTKPPAADLLRHIFDVAALRALPPAKADDIPWLQWGAAVDQSYTRIILFGVKPGQAPDQLVPATVKDREAQKNLTAFAGALAAAN